MKKQPFLKLVSFLVSAFPPFCYKRAAISIVGLFLPHPDAATYPNIEDPFLPPPFRLLHRLDAQIRSLTG